MSALNADEIARYRQDGLIVPRTRLAPEVTAQLQAKLESFLQAQNITDADDVPDIIDRDRIACEHDVDHSDAIVLNQSLKPEHLNSAPPRDIELAARQVREMGVLDLSKRELHRVRGVDRSGRNDLYRPAPDETAIAPSRA